MSPDDTLPGVTVEENDFLLVERTAEQLQSVHFEIWDV